MAQTNEPVSPEAPKVAVAPAVETISAPVEVPPSADTMKTLKAARKAAKNDPTVQSLYSAREALDKQIDAAIDAAVVAANPSLSAEIEKIKECKDRAKTMRDRFDSLTPEQRQALKEARKAAKEDPAVVAAKDKVKAATTPEEKQAAIKELFQVRRDAMVRQNPELASVLDKLGPPSPMECMPMKDGGKDFYGKHDGKNDHDKKKHHDDEMDD